VGLRASGVFGGDVCGPTAFFWDLLPGGGVGGGRNDTRLWAAGWPLRAPWRAENRLGTAAGAAGGPATVYPGRRADDEQRGQADEAESVEGRRVAADLDELAG